MLCRCFNVAGMIDSSLGKRLSRLTVTNISNLTKIDRGVLLLFTGQPESAATISTSRAVEIRIGGPRPGVLEGKTAECYFQKGLRVHSDDDLSGQGPGYMIVKLSLASADSDGPGAGDPAGQRAPATGRASCQWWRCQPIENRRFRDRFGFRLRI